jgi:Icc-related predicted phosphoesterase
MIISAISDLDILGMDLEPFWDILKKAKEPDLLLFAGDMYEFQAPEVYGLILDFIKMRKWNCPIVAVFGNREFDEDIDDIKKISKKRIIFLNDESIELKIRDKKIGIVGSRGSLDAPTWWQYHHVSGIKDEYEERIDYIKRMLQDLRSDVKILLTHYSPTYKTLKGENQRLFSYLGSNKLEKVLVETKTDFAVHGHAHYGLPLAFVESIPVFNVCLEINKRLVEIDPDNLPKTGLKKFA